MIYYKKKSGIKRVWNSLTNFPLLEIERAEKTAKGKSFKNKTNPLKLLKFLSFFFLFFVLALYCCYLFILPDFINEENVESYLNSYLKQNTKLSFDIENIKISPNYKFDINIKAKKIRLIYPNKKDFVTLDKINCDINLINLLFKRLDISKVNIKKAVINVDFKNKYECFNYINQNIFEKSHGFKIGLLKIALDDFEFNLNDKNVKKTYKIKIQKAKLNKFLNNITLSSETGKISQNKKTLVDFQTNITFKLKEDSVNKFANKIFNYNYNPFIYADNYNFYTKADIDLKYVLSKKTFDGYIKLKDFSFDYFNIKIPKNNFIVNFKNEKIYTNCKFNLINNQFINLELKTVIGKFIEANVLSNDINLEEFYNVSKILLKIMNVKYNFENISLKGKAKADIYLKSNFKTINSKGNLDIINAKIIMKEPYFVLDKINSNISFLNNKINIINSSAIINNKANQEKFYLKGTIDEKTNLDLDINSDSIDISRFFEFVKNLSMISNKDGFSKINIQKGFLKVKVKVKGSLKNPYIQSNSKIYDLNAYLKDLKTNVLIKLAQIDAYPTPKKVGEITISIDNLILKNKNNQNNPVALNNIKASVNENNIKLKAQIPAKNDYFNLKTNETSFDLNLNSTINKNKFIINELKLLSRAAKEGSLLNLTGEIADFKTNPMLNLKASIPNKLSLILYNPGASLDIIGNLNISKSINNPNIDGAFNISNLHLNDLKAHIQDFNLNIKNSNIKIANLKGKIANNDFVLSSDIKLLKEKILINTLIFNSNYINLDEFSKFQNNKNASDLNKLSLEILDLKGLITTVENKDFTLDSFDFKGNFKNNILILDDFRANLYDGKIQGNLSYNLKNKKTKINTTIKEIGVRHLSNKLKEFSIAISGRLSTYIDAEFILTNDENLLLRSLNSYIKFNIDDGELNQFAKLERFLQAGNIVSQGILKLSLNSLLSTVTKQNTGYFKTIEGTIKIKDNIGNIQYIKTKGNNMSMLIKGRYSILNNSASLKILGRIPYSIVSVMGNVGKFSADDILNKPDENEQEKTDNNLIDTDNIPLLVNQTSQTPTRLFSVIISGDITKTSSIKLFRWISD